MGLILKFEHLRLASVQYYDPSKDCWQLLPTMPTQRRWCAGAALHGQIYVIGGQQEGHVLNTAERFDVDTRRWETLPDMPSCREACAVASLWFLSLCPWWLST